MLGEQHAGDRNRDNAGLSAPDNEDRLLPCPVGATVEAEADCDGNGSSDEDKHDHHRETGPEVVDQRTHVKVEAEHHENCEHHDVDGLCEVRVERLLLNAVVRNAQQLFVANDQASDEGSQVRRSAGRLARGVSQGDHRQQGCARRLTEHAKSVVRQKEGDHHTSNDADDQADADALRKLHQRSVG